MLYKELSLLETWLMWSELTHGIRTKGPSGKRLCLFWLRSMLLPSLCVFCLCAVPIFSPLTLELLAPCCQIQGGLACAASAPQIWGSKVSNKLLLVKMLRCLASLLSYFLFTAWSPNKETSQGFLSAPPSFLVKDIVSGFMWTLVFHGHCWFHHLWISLILTAVIGLDLFLISSVTAAGKATALLMDFVGLIFDSILTAKADSLLKQCYLCI